MSMEFQNPSEFKNKDNEVFHSCDSRKGMCRLKVNSFFYCELQEGHETKCDYPKTKKEMLEREIVAGMVKRSRKRG